MVNVIDTCTFGAHFPGWNRHLLNALTAELSRIEFPILFAILASVTDPLAVSTLMTQTPVPVM